MRSWMLLCFFCGREHKHDRRTGRMVVSCSIMVMTKQLPISTTLSENTAYEEGKSRQPALQACQH